MSAAPKSCPLAKSKMTKLRTHAARLASALNGIGGSCPKEFTSAVAYLEMCSGIEKITFNTFEFDQCVGFCEPADDFRDEHDDLREALVHRLTMFLFCWAALESIVSAMKLPPVQLPKGQASGKIERLCGYITNNFAGRTLEELPELISCLRCTIGRSDLTDKLSAQTVLPSFVGPPAEGVHLVYKLRNAFAHGDFNVPWPAQDERPVTSHPDVVVVAISARVVLLTIQTLVLCYVPPTTIVEMVEISGDHEEGVEISRVFTRLHLDSFTSDLVAMLG